MTAKEYLSQIGCLRRKIKHKQAELEEAKQSIGIAGAHDGKRVQTSLCGSSGDQAGNQAIRIVSLEEKLERQIAEYTELKDRIVDQIHSLDDSIDIDILYLRYVQEERHFEKISCDLGYSYQYIVNRHGEALKRFEAKFPEVFCKDVIKC